MKKTPHTTKQIIRILREADAAGKATKNYALNESAGCSAMNDFLALVSVLAGVTFVELAASNLFAPKPTFICK